MSATLGLTEQQLFETLRSFLLAILPSGTEIVRGQVNRVPEPTGQNFVVMLPVLRTRLATTSNEYDAATSGIKSATEPAQVTLQCDFHGPASADNAQIFVTLFRDAYACEFFDATGLPIAPLYADDAKQLPFLNGEKQIEERWSVDAVMQGNFVVTTPQDFADSISIGIINADAAYPA